MSAIVGADELAGPSARRDAPQALLERHFYDAGLKVQVLGSDRMRPSWVPPSEWVGFRNELPLRPGDHVVEFVRFLYGDNVVTWIGLFHPSVDAKYGDRQNHAGVGVWLGNRDVLHGKALLQSLRTFSESSTAGASANADAADRFVNDYLGTLIIPRLDVPQPLGGWPIARGEMTDTALFEAVASDEGAAWGLAAQQLLRMAILYNAARTLARALILVPGGTDGPRGLEPVSKNLEVEIVEALPRALAAMSEERQAVEREAAGAAEMVRRFQAEAAEARSRNEELDRRAQDLAQEAATARSALDQSEPARVYAEVREALRQVANGLEAVDGSVREARRDLGGQIQQLRQARTQRPEPDRLEPSSQSIQPGSIGTSSTGLAAKAKSGGGMGGGGGLKVAAQQYVWWVAGVAALLVLAAMIYLFWWNPRPSAPAPPQVFEVPTRR